MTPGEMESVGEESQCPYSPGLISRGMAGWLLLALLEYPLRSQL
jgi:hypothetical protein